MMDIREKLVELLNRVQDNGQKTTHEEHSITVCVKRNEDIADHLIANGVTVQEWIPVTERLPETTCRNFVMTNHGITVIAYFDGNVWRYGETLFVVDVTHWMPLPAPPKGE